MENSNNSSLPPPIPQRPLTTFSNNQNYLPFYNQNNNTSYPYQRQQYFPNSSGMFNYYQQPPDPYGFSRINNSQPMTTYEFFRTAEESTRGAFQSIEHVASAFLSIASLLNSTYGAVFNSFRAIISVVEQLKSLKHFLVSTFLLTLIRWIRFLWRRLLASLRVRPRNYANSASIWAGINGELEQTKKSSNFGTLIFWIIAIGGPLLVIKYFLQQIRENTSELTSDWATGQAEHYTAQALYDFSAASQNELSFSTFDTLRIAPKQKQPEIKDWLLASNSDGSKIGLVPINYIRILDHNNNPN